MAIASKFVSTQIENTPPDAEFIGFVTGHD
jgi:hypothetical protein